MTPMSTRHSHCSGCGRAYAPDSPWPRTCEGCDLTTWLNPLPVAVLLVPVDSRGLLLVRRSIDPGLGQLALPGGYINLGETWQEAGARELLEETRISVDPAHIRDVCAQSTANGKVVVFGVTPPVPHESVLSFRETPEVSELAVAEHPMELAFPSHTERLRCWFDAAR